MVKRHVRVYIEGGSTGRTADSDFRRGWKKFLSGLHELAMGNGYHSLEVVRGKGRGRAFGRFKGHTVEHANDLCVLLVDSEGPVRHAQQAWDVVAQRRGDQWTKPDWAQESHLYLMVQFVETWLLTDQDALKKFFKSGFDPSSLPTTNLESRSKDEIERALNRATKDSSKGPYCHGQAHEIIEFVRPQNVKRLNHGRRLFETLEGMIRIGSNP